MRTRGWLPLAIVVALGFVSGSTSAAECNGASVEERVRSFYLPGGYDTNVPPRSELAKTTRPFTRRLHALLVAAADYRDDLIAKYPPVSAGPGQPKVIFKPPFTDGDIFRGAWAAAIHFRISDVREVREAHWQARVTSTPGEPQHSPWSVTVQLETEDDACVIDEIVYGDGSLLSTELGWRGGR